MIQASGRGGKSEWFFQDSSIRSRSIETKETLQKVTNDKIVVYPNPASHSIQIHKNSEGTILLYSINGKLVKSYPKNQETIDVSALNNGIYFIKVNNSISKFVKQ